MGDAMDDDQVWRGRLAARREHLQSVGDSGDAAADVVELDQSRVGRLSRMDALATQAMAAEGNRRRAVELARIDAALARIDAGEFGACLDCGADIALARLELDPSSTLCIDCASRREAGS